MRDFNDIERDAARYRWLRERNLDTIEKGGVFAGMTPENVILNGEDLDDAVDAATLGRQSQADTEVKTMEASKTAAEMGLPGRVHMSRKQAEYHAALIVQEVAELGDRTSPEDMPEMMLVTGEELLVIVVGQLLE